MNGLRSARMRSLVLALGLGLTLVTAPPALAGTATATDDPATGTITVHYDAASGEANDVRMYIDGTDVVVADGGTQTGGAFSGVPVSVSTGSGCRPDVDPATHAVQARCAIQGETHIDVSVALGDENDRFEPGGTPSGFDRIDASGGTGDDVLVTDAIAGTLDGGDGNDLLQTWDEGPRSLGPGGHVALMGGAGDDTIYPNGDDVDAGPGNDWVEARNGYRETIFCGDGTDNVRADRVDSVDGSCEHEFPWAAFTWSPASPQTGQQVTLTDASASNTDQIVAIKWDLDNDGTFDTSGPSTAVTFDTAGDHAVLLQITDAAGNVDESTEVIHVTDPPPNSAPVASFTFDPASAETGTPIAFQSTSHDPDGDATIASTHWDFGDGTTADGASVSHAYATAGTYSVTLTVSDDHGAQDSTTQEITISAPAGQTQDSGGSGSDTGTSTSSDTGTSTSTDTGTSTSSDTSQASPDSSTGPDSQTPPPASSPDQGGVEAVTTQGSTPAKKHHRRHHRRRHRRHRRHA